MSSSLVTWFGSLVTMVQIPYLKNHFKMLSSERSILFPAEATGRRQGRGAGLSPRAAARGARRRRRAVRPARGARRRLPPLPVNTTALDNPTSRPKHIN